MMMVLKHKKKWPIQIKLPKKESPIAFNRPHVGVSLEATPEAKELYISCPVIFKVWNRKSQHKIRSVELEIINDYTKYSGYEAYLPDYSPDYSRLQGMRVNTIHDALYKIIFRVPIVPSDNFLKEWFNSDCVPDMYSKIRLAIDESVCEADLGIIKRQQGDKAVAY